MYSPNYVQDPTQQRLNSLFAFLCSSVNGKDQLILSNQCFQVVDSSGSGSVSNQLCLTNFGYPTDTSTLVNQEILAGETLTLFDNGLENYFALPLPANKSFVRGIILLVTYPTTDSNGVSIDPSLYTCQLDISTLTQETATAPYVSAGPPLNLAVTSSSGTLMGSAVPNNGATITSVQWTQTGSPATVAILSPAELTTFVNNITVPGTYTFRLQATDSNGLSGYASTVINLAVPNATPPTVNAGASQTLATPVTTATITGTAIANGGATIVSTLWTQTGGPNTATITSPSSLSTAVTGLVPGLYTFNLHAVDSAGFVSDAVTTVTISSVSSIVLPLNTFFSHFSNPVTTNASEILDSISVTNVSATFSVYVQALLIYTKTEDPNSPTNCNC